ncbi:MBL fold metallo-hydrolase [Candidatus Gottesmanbacteria bacterium]|nr:MBL fold metallo-hydrolase [Candidatus Gottesmanbacteria bacterium]
MTKRQKACGTVTLIRGIYNCLVDTGNVVDEDKIKRLLAKENLSPKKINFVINTHGDIDHVGCNMLFKQSVFISGQDVYRGDIYSPLTDNYEIEPDIHVVSTPGHSIEDISVAVKTEKGLVVVSGDLFENEDDQENGAWKVFSKYPKHQVLSRTKILKIADYIIPGHGKIFRVK